MSTATESPYSTTFKSHRCGIETPREQEIDDIVNSNRTVAGLKRHSLRASLRAVKFKSHRCGIETLGDCGYDVRVGFKSHRCGIETDEGSTELQECSGFKSHRCGIETSIFSVMSVMNNSNRTVAGLKLPVDGLLGGASHSNRTVAGLKPP